MKILGFHIDGFGLFANQGVARLPPGMVVFEGANESGKSTLRQFFSAMLLGFDRQRPGRPLHGGRHGGRLLLELDDGRRLTLERLAGEPVENEAVIQQLLGGLDRDSFQRIFAIGRNELSGLEVWSQDTLRDRLLAAGAGLGEHSLSRSLARLDQQRRALLTDRGQRPRINHLLTERARCEADLRRLQGELAEDAALSRRLEESEGQLEALRRELLGLDDEHRQLAERQPAEPPARNPPRPRLPLWWGFLAPLVVIALGLLFLLPTGSLDPAVRRGLLLAVAAAGALLAWGLWRRRPRPYRQPPLPQDSQPEESRSESEDLARRRRRLLDEMADLQRQAGAVERERQRLRHEERSSEHLLEREVLHRRLRQAVREWAAASLAAQLLAETREHYERQHQPRLLQRTDHLVETLTAGRYRLHHEEDGAVKLEDRDLTLKGEDAWSRGLADQVYLAARLALAEELGRQGERIPILLDDVLLEFDPERKRAAAATLCNVARRHQVLLFTCDPATRRAVEAAGGEDLVARYHLREGRIRPADPEASANNSS